MQKKFALVIVISLCLLLTACGGNTNAPSDTTSSNMADSINTYLVVVMIPASCNLYLTEL